MNVLFLAHHDNANAGWSMMQAAKCIPGVNVQGFACMRHPFKYPEEMPQWVDAFDERYRHWRDEWADVVWLYNTVPMHGYTEKFYKPVVIQHGDDELRRNKTSLGIKSFNGRVVHVAETSDYALYPEIPYYIPPPVDVELLTPDKWDQKGRFRRWPRFGHFPTILDNKGSYFIWGVWKTLIREGHKIEAATWDGGEHHLTEWNKSIRRMWECDVYVDQHSLNRLQGPPIGVMGVSAREAAALGVIPMSNERPEVYKKHYGIPPFGLVVCNTGPEWYRKTKALCNMGQHGRERRKSLAREWVCQNHSYEATAPRIQRVLEDVLA